MNKKTLKDLDDCIADLDNPIRELSKIHNPEVLMSAMLETSLRMFLLAGGSAHVLRIFAGSVSNICTLGPMIDAMIVAGDKTDPLNFRDFTNLTLVPEDETFH